MSQARLVTLVVLTLSVGAPVSACPAGVEWYAIVPADKRSVVEATITYTGKQALYDVSFEATYFNHSSEVGRRTHAWQGLGADGLLEGLHTQRFEHGYAAPTTATGGNLSFKCKLVGISPKLTQPTNVHTVAARTVSQVVSDFSGNWANQDSKLEFIQFFDIERTDPTSYRVTVWLRCPPEVRWTTRQSCNTRWGPRTALLQPGGQLLFDEPGDGVGRNVLSLEDGTLKALTPKTGWVNYFRRVP